LSNNQFASGGLLVVAVGGLLAYLRSLPYQLWKLFLRNCTNQVSFLNTDLCFEWVERWFSTNYSPWYGSYMVNEDNKDKRVRRYTLEQSSPKDYNYYLAPNYGWYYKIYKNRIITINKVSEKGSGNDNRIRDRIDIRIFGSKVILESFLSDIRQEYIKSKEQGMTIYSLSTFGDWQKQSSRDYVNKPILPDGLYDKLKNDMNNFYNSYELYKEKGILHKRGYMFYGFPGTGKTSTIASLAFDLKKDIYIMDMTSGFSNSSFMSAVSLVPNNAVLVLEDVDCFTKTRPREDKDSEEDSLVPLSMSTILNVFDGFATPTGLVFVITTNHKDKLDSALIRPGRIDVSVEFTHPTITEIKELYIRLLGTEEGFDRFFADNKIESMAEAQTKILESYNVGI
jgi:chaperone BCS1